MPTEEKNLENQIRAHILEHADGPGSRIETEEQLARRFNVSRYRVRNVLTGMVQQGVITKSPRRGTVINTLNTETITNNLMFNYQVTNANLYEAIEARIVIELSIIPLVVRRITPGEIFIMNSCIEKMLANKKKPRIADQADMEFHTAMLGASRNNLLQSYTQIISQLFRKVDYREKYWTEETIQRLALEHRSILEAIQNGNTAQATERLKQHLHYATRIEMNGAS
jgi:GntR family galactonate operon transcriptional repressor